MSTGSAVSIEVPDIGDFEDVPIIEILVSAGDRVAADDPLITLESDKATMDVPAPFDGVIGELQVQVGDRVSQGSPLLTIEPESDTGASAEASAAASEGAPDEAAASTSFRIVPEPSSCTRGPSTELSRRRYMPRRIPSCEPSGIAGWW